eukprot:1377532-Pleurochrysis_carterae.AAC.4
MRRIDLCVENGLFAGDASARAVECAVCVFRTDKTHHAPARGDRHVSQTQLRAVSARLRKVATPATESTAVQSNATRVEKVGEMRSHPARGQQAEENGAKAAHRQPQRNLDLVAALVVERCLEDLGDRARERERVDVACGEEEGGLFAVDHQLYLTEVDAGVTNALVAHHLPSGVLRRRLRLYKHEDRYLEGAVGRVVGRVPRGQVQQHRGGVGLRALRARTSPDVDCFLIDNSESVTCHADAHLRLVGQSSVRLPLHSVLMGRGGRTGGFHVWVDFSAPRNISVLGVGTQSRQLQNMRPSQLPFLFTARSETH